MRRLFSLGSMAAACTNIDSSSRVEEKVTTSPADPEVVAFFKYFPEPYRQHAIERYSKREGLYRWKIFRNLDMEKEKEAALRGVFLEDTRRAEQAAKEQNEADIKAARETEKQRFYEREIPDWERWVLKYIPLQPGETMLLKLAQAASTSFTGLSFVALGVVSSKQPKIPKMKAAATLVAGSILCIYCQIAAYARLMDLGPFDLSVDDRPLPEKLADDLKQGYEEIVNLVKNSSTQS